MSDCRTIDSLVTPYVDGELVDADRRAVDAHLLKCPPCHSRVTAERAVRDALCARRRELAAKNAPPALRAACTKMCAPKIAPTPDSSAPSARGAARPASGTRSAADTLGRLKTRLVPFALAASLVIIVGGAFVYQMTDVSATVMTAELVADHAKCFGLNAVLGTHETPTAVEAAMLGGFGWNVHLPQDPADAGLELVGARPCLYGEGRIAHVMYRHNGRPVSLFMLPKSARAEQFVEVLGHEAKIWCAGNRTLVLIAQEPRKNVEKLAEFVQASLH